MKLDSEKERKKERKERKKKGIFLLQRTSVHIHCDQPGEEAGTTKCLMMGCPGRNMRSIKSRWWRKSKFEPLLKDTGLEIKLLLHLRQV